MAVFRGTWIVNVVVADPPAGRLTGLMLNVAGRNDDAESVTFPAKLSMLDRDTVACPDPP